MKTGTQAYPRGDVWRAPVGFFGTDIEPVIGSISMTELSVIRSG